MIPVETLAAFFAASVILALAPGPDNIFVLTQAALYGRISGIFVMFGLCTGLIVHTTAVAFGVAAIFKVSEIAFTGLKIFGACYLAWLAWQAFRASASEITGSAHGKKSLGKLYRRGILMNITNPKVSIFFLAFLPQFADPARGSLTVQIVLLGGIFILATLLIFGGIAFLAGSIGGWFSRSAKAQVIMNRVAGTVFILLALKLASTSR
ncbi:MAG: LysE family translocator [Desulfobacteraceae bacterium]|nr:LysE family translocator [Desulfobacteraceae bacterium]MBU4054087.1 LysE family translocator [Pseudomonadota bacterium]